MKLTFNLSDRQLARAKEYSSKSNSAYRDVLGNYPIEEWEVNGKIVSGYYNDLRRQRFVWLGELIGFVSVADKQTCPEISMIVHTRKLITEAPRAVLTLPDVVERVAAILGKAWRIAIPDVIEGEETPSKLFWWETEEHYVQWRSDWDTYFNWLLPRIDREQGISKFDDRFYNENFCLQLLKSGKLAEARQKFPGIADQILQIA